MADKHQSPTFIAFDFETTGFNPATDRIIEVGVFKFTYSPTGKLVKLDEYSQLVNPETRLPIETQSITGISPQDLHGKPTINQLVAKLASLFSNGDYLLGHNVDFDLAFLSKLIEVSTPAIDSQLFAELFFPGLPSYSLDVLPYELDLERVSAHRALDDSKVSAQLFLAALHQFSVSKEKDIVLSVLQKAGRVEAEILRNIKRPFAGKKYTPPTIKARKQKDIPVLQQKIADYLPGINKTIVAHTPLPGASEAVIKTIDTKKKNTPFILAVRDDDQARLPEKAFVLPNASHILCDQRLDGMAKRSFLTAAEALLTAKLLIARGFGVWPKLEKNERMCLPQLLYHPELCRMHACSGYKKLQLLKKTDSFVSVTHYDFFQLPTDFLPTDFNMVITDFDEAADTLMRGLEVRLDVNTLHDLLRCLPIYLLNTVLLANGQLPLVNDSHALKIKIEKCVQEIITRNDLFWGLVNINYAVQFESHRESLLKIDRQDGAFNKLGDSIKKIIDGILSLATYLRETENEYLIACATSLDEHALLWRKLERGRGYTLYLEQGMEGKRLFLSPSFSEVSKIFKKKSGPNVLLTAGFHDDAILSHYCDMLELEEWPITKIEIPAQETVLLKVVESRNQPTESALTLLLSEEFNKAVVVTKNNRESALYGEHFRMNLPDKNVLYLDKTGSGVNKIIYAFQKEKDAILIIPPRGRIWNLHWPIVDLALIAGIPFPAPNQEFGFMEWAFPKAILQYKLLVSKFLVNGSPELKIMLLDPRFTTTGYGDKFVSLAADLCGHPPEYIKID